MVKPVRNGGVTDSRHESSERGPCLSSGDMPGRLPDRRATRTVTTST